MKITKVIWAIVAILLLTLVGGQFNNTASQEKDKKISKSKLPSAVQDAFKKAYPKAKILGTAEEKENNVTYYEVESMDGKQRRDFLYTFDGKVYEMEELMALKDLSQGIKETIKKDFAGYKFSKAEKTTNQSGVSFDVNLKKGKTKLAIVFDETGKVIKKTEIKAKSKNEKEDDEKD